MTTTTISRNGAFGGILPRFLPTLSRIAGGVVTYAKRRHAASQLEALDDRLLADIGVSRCDIRDLVWGRK